jgi:hypothetical protein
MQPAPSIDLPKGHQKVSHIRVEVNFSGRLCVFTNQNTHRFLSAPDVKSPFLFPLQ